MAINATIEMFEDNSERILWLPSVTLGYIYTLSGDVFQFWMAVGAIGGVQFIGLLIESDYNFDRLREHFSTFQTWVLGLFTVLYASAVLCGIFQLYHYFTYQDIILVGLAGIWWGIFIVIVVNLTIISKPIDNV